MAQGGTLSDSGQASVARVAVVGIGNPLAGDDGAGPAVVEELRRRSAALPGVLFVCLEGDLFAVADLLPRARRFVFVDSVIGPPPGTVVRRPPTAAAFAPSLHQADIGAVMAAFAALELVHPFPPWEVWGIAIAPPRELGEGLTPPVAAAVAALAAELERTLAQPPLGEDGKA